MFATIAKKNAGMRTELEFVLIIWTEKGKTLTSEDSKEGVIGHFVVKTFIGAGVL